MALSPTVPFDYSRTKEHDVSCIIIDGAFVDVSNVYVVAYIRFFYTLRCYYNVEYLTGAVYSKCPLESFSM